MNDNRSNPPRLDERGRTTPDCRASILAMVVASVACHDGVVATGDLFTEVLEHLGVAEEAAGSDILAAMHLAVRSGLLISNRFDPSDQSMTFGAKTCLAASNALLAFVWNNDFGPEDEGEAA
jgi:hypothetical protein